MADIHALPARDAHAAARLAEAVAHLSDSDARLAEVIGRIGACGLRPELVLRDFYNYAETSLTLTFRDSEHLLWPEMINRLRKRNDEVSGIQAFRPRFIQEIRVWGRCIGHIVDALSPDSGKVDDELIDLCSFFSILRAGVDAGLVCFIISLTTTQGNNNLCIF